MEKNLISVLLNSDFINHIWESYFIYPLYTDINECAPDPCQNSGTCKDLVNGYECTCVPGYDGTNCDNGRNVNYIFGEENPCYRKLTQY